MDVVDLYAAIRARRDVRTQFTGEPIDPDVLERVLEAAHAAPSVGMSQPWEFVLVDDPATRARFAEHVAAERAAFAAELEGERAETFAPIVVEGVLTSSLGIVVGCDAERAGPVVLGARTVPETQLFSTVLAIQNLWLAATAEGLGVGWVSFYREEVLRELVGLPEYVRPVAWLCVGPVTHLETVPDLERLDWRARRPLADVVHRNRYEHK